MDPKLAEIYGTNQNTEADLEKLAAAELATKLAGDEGAEEETNVDGMTEEDLEAIAQNVLGGSEEQQEEQAEETEAGDDAQEKVAEADYLGRVMAHAYVQELSNIEKTADEHNEFEAGHFNAKSGDPAKAKTKIKDAVKGAVEKAKAVPGKVGSHLANVGAKAGNMARMSGPMSKGKAMAIGGGVYGAGALGAAGLGLAAKKAFGKKNGKEKKSSAEGEMSAVDTLVMARANEILQASGIDPTTLTKVEEQEKVSADETMDPRQVLAAAVEQRAWELLGQYGVGPVEQ